MSRPSQMRTAGLLLAGGWLTFWAGALCGLLPSIPQRWWFPIPVDEYLELVSSHQGAWLWIAATFALGVVLTLAGFVVLGVELRAAGERTWSQLGQVAYLLGSALWLASIAFRATGTISAAREAASSGAVPSWFEPLRTWAGLLFAIYMVLAYLALAAYGQALLATTLAPRWIARTLLYFGLAGTLGFLARVPFFSPPLMIHPIPGILGVVLLLRDRSGAATRT